MSNATKPPEQGGPVPDRALTPDHDRTEASGDDHPQVAEAGEKRALEAILQKALSEALAEIAKREEAEQKLDRVRIEAASLAIELNQALRDLEEARDSVTPSAAERIEKLEEELDQARSELVRERERREQLERDYDAAAHQSEKQLAQLRDEAQQALAGAAHAQTAVEAAHTELNETREQLEGAHAELNETREQLEGVRLELMAACDELATARAGHEEQLAQLRERHEQQVAQLREGHEEQVAELREGHEQQLVELRQGHEQEVAAEHPTRAEQLPEAPSARPGRLRRRKRLFEARGRTCAVCRRTEAASPGALQADGWVLGAEIDLCSECQEKGWQLPRGGSLPFRRSSRRDEVG